MSVLTTANLVMVATMAGAPVHLHATATTWGPIGLLVSLHVGMGVGAASGAALAGPVLAGAGYALLAGGWALLRLVAVAALALPRARTARRAASPGVARPVSPAEGAACG